MTDLAIETSLLAKDYGNERGLFGVDLSVREGEVFGFLGPNGSGKTTFMRLVLGLVRPSSGTGSVFGMPIGQPRAVESIGALVESPALYGQLTGRENLRYFARQLGAEYAAVEAALTAVSLEAAADQRFASYSLGMKQRLGLALAMMKQPRILMLDEPTNGLDPQGLVDMRELILKMRDRGTTVFLSSHLMTEVELVCDRVGILRHGRLVAEGTVAEITSGQSVDRFEVTTADSARTSLMLAAIPDVTSSGDLVDGVWFTAAPARGAAILTQLVVSGIAVDQYLRKERSLEAAFFDLLGESRSAEPDLAEVGAISR